MQAMGQTAGALNRTGVLTTGYLAYKNHYEMTGNRMGALWQALLTARRWYVWFIACWWLLGWLIFTAWLAYVDHHDIGNDHFVDYSQGPFGGSMLTHLWHQWLIGWPVMFVWMGVLYCRNIDSGMFKQRFVYRLFRRIYVAMEWCPSFFIYAWLPVWFWFNLPIPV
jgi:hypothetical protein